MSPTMAYRIPPSHRPLLPLLASLTWFATLTTLLTRWLALGLPRYPGQANPYVPFISDIAAFTLQPVFIAGCAITGVAFAGTVLAVHHHHHYYYRDSEGGAWWWCSGAAVLAGWAAATGLVLLGVYDTFDSHETHRYLLAATCGALAACAVLTTGVWWHVTAPLGGASAVKQQEEDQAPPARLRMWCRVNTLLVACQAVVGIAFLVFLYTGWYRVAGILEWTLTYLGSFWLLSFAGMVRSRDDGESLESDSERQPLLSSA